MNTRDLTIRKEVKRRSVIRWLENKEGRRYFSKHLDAEFLSSDPQNAANLREWLLNDLAGLEFLNSFSKLKGVIPRLVDSDARNFSILEEDIGDGQQIDEILSKDNAEAATTALCRLMETLALVHGETLGKKQQYYSLRKSLGHFSAKDGGIELSLEGYLVYLRRVAAEFEIPFSERISDEIREMLHAIFDESEFQAYTHWDPCPDNCRIVDGKLILYDFERGDFASLFVDAVYPLMRFPSCWCVGQLPENSIEKALSAYQRSIASYLPRLADPREFQRGLALACGFWFLRSTDWLFDRASKADRLWGPVATFRQRIVLRAEIAHERLEECNLFPELSRFISAMATAFHARWQTAPMPMYVAFSGPTT